MHEEKEMPRLPAGPRVALGREADAPGRPLAQCSHEAEMRLVSFVYPCGDMKNGTFLHLFFFFFDMETKSFNPLNPHLTPPNPLTWH